ncbi:MAG: 50S ribosomal protein L29 [Desulfobacula sp.]|uniref:50S ribosomal protein L29 n=1 Tax=Desulfobacula sp. TaxID=2593537 RepID=UPI0025C24136|nr:50S ribosomal protein L29 [Desulfobacula sp.]MBC2704818.1 50S ribosomal protein L29 [Desulfobacula sp.]MCK4768501.1 50S ribosomal protein L29 [Desulfobacula sp.]MCK5348597.1 50S ribosomal protein L29 [Desulfobacula sp.]
MKASKIKAGEIREMGADQMKEKLVELKKELFNLRFQNDVGQLENTSTLSNVKKDIAKLYTISKEMNVNIS